MSVLKFETLDPIDAVRQQAKNMLADRLEDIAVEPSINVQILLNFNQG